MTPALQKEFDKQWAKSGLDPYHRDNIKIWLTTVYTPALLRELEEKIKEARSDAAPFNREPIEHARNLIEQKNKILDDILSLLKESDRV